MICVKTERSLQRIDFDQAGAMLQRQNGQAGGGLDERSRANGKTEIAAYRRFHCLVHGACGKYFAEPDHIRSGQSAFGPWRWWRAAF